MSDERNKELLEKLESGIKETMESERYKAFLKVQSYFHGYSFNNSMLIFMQRPDATKVAGFNTWKKLDRYVMRGEKGITIIAPNPYKYETWLNKLDPVTKEPMRNPKTGEIIKEKAEGKGYSFRPVTVFDIKQTDGKELPEICNELQGNSINSESIIKAIKQISDVPIIEKDIISGAKGYYSRSEGIIAIQQCMSLDQTSKTLIHEYAHSQLHNTDAGAALDRATKEVQAESVAFIVSERFGVDTSNYSFDYLANWSSGKEQSELKSSFDLIQETADKAIRAIEDFIKKDLALQNSPVKLVIQWSESSLLNSGQVFANMEEANKIFVKLDREQAELRKANPDIDYSKVTAGEQIANVPFLKTKFEVHLSDGRVSEGRYDFGESGYKDLYDCINCECGIDVKEYIIKNTIFENTKITYIEEFPAIKHISKETAMAIDSLNLKEGRILSIDNIKDLHHQAGKKLEASGSNIDKEVFTKLQSIVDDFKQAQLTEKQMQATEKVALNQLQGVKDMEIVQ